MRYSISGTLSLVPGTLYLQVHTWHKPLEAPHPLKAERPPLARLTPSEKTNHLTTTKDDRGKRATRPRPEEWPRRSHAGRGRAPKISSSQITDRITQTVSQVPRSTGQECTTISAALYHWCLALFTFQVPRSTGQECTTISAALYHWCLALFTSGGGAG